MESGADAASIHITSLWKIPSIDLPLIRQAALGIPLRFLLGQLRSKREPKRVGLGAGASPAFPIDPDATLVARQQPPVSPGPSSPQGRQDWAVKGVRDRKRHHVRSLCLSTLTVSVIKPGVLFLLGKHFCAGNSIFSPNRPLYLATHLYASLVTKTPHAHCTKRGGRM